MTIAIELFNTSKDRDILVTSTNLGQNLGSTSSLGPEEKQTFYVHSTQILVVKEGDLRPAKKEM